MMRINIDSTEIEVVEGRSVLEAALDAGIYIPHLCYHPDLPAHTAVVLVETVYQGAEVFPSQNGNGDHSGCSLCLVEVEGCDGPVKACELTVADGMAISTDSPRLVSARREHLAEILARHPHACLSCAQRFGCALEPCSTKTEKNERCCALFGRCQLQKVAEFIGISQETPRYVPAGLERVEDQPLLDLDFNLCIGCTLCVRACTDLRGVGALGAVVSDGRMIVGTVAPTLRESECKFCTACAEVCPTGAILDKNMIEGEREKALVPCTAHCPAGIDIPRYIRLIANGEFEEAVAVVREKVPFPHVLGQVCYRPCESVCRRVDIDESVAICALKLFAAEQDKGSWRERANKSNATGKKVAIVGSGPAGLTASYYLARMGHSVSLFEAAPELGGMMRYGIPAYRLPTEILDQEINRIVELGVEVHTNTPLNGEHSLEKLRSDDFEAVVLSVGKSRSKSIDIGGTDLKGVHDGVGFLKSVRENGNLELEDPVVVIGGGNVAIDVARSAVRLGARAVKLVCLEKREEMPAHDWEIEEALSEGIELICSFGPQKLAGSDGSVASVEFIRALSVYDEAGRFDPKMDPEDRMSMEAGTVILAIGQAADLTFLSDEERTRLASSGAIATRNGKGETALPWLFACGDVTAKTTNVIEAIAAGRRTAEAVDRYLGGDGDLTESFSDAALDPAPLIGHDEGFNAVKRISEPTIEVRERIADFRRIILPYSASDAVREAQRCLQCDLRLDISAPVLPPDEWLEFSEEMLAQIPETPGVYRLCDENRKIVAIKGVENLRKALVECENDAAEPRCFSWQEDPMFTKRESELIQAHLQQYGELPGGGDDDLDDLF